MENSGLISHARRVNTVLCGQTDDLFPGIDQYVARSWYRCANDYRLDPLHPGETPVIQRPRLLERIDIAGELLRIASEESRNIYAQTRGSGYVIAVTDSDGVILSWIGDPTLDKQFSKSGMQTGAIWDERHKGTNGMGTCLAEGKAVTIHNEDHFFGSHSGLTCTGVPIRNTRGEIAAILDASSLNAPGDKAGQIYTSALLQMSAKRIEHWYFLKSYGSEIILRLNRRAELIGTIDDALLALDVTGRILATNDVTLDQLKIASRHLLIGSNIEEVFGVRIEQILAANHDSGNTPATIRAIASGGLFFVMAREAPHRTEVAQQRINGAPAANDLPTLDLDDIAGEDPTMAANVARARSVVDRAVPILLSGETGTGKDAFARALHNESARREMPFVSINCAAISKQHLENELFGSPLQSVSTASDSRGKLQIGGVGTLFLDEVGEMSQELQSRFLKILEDRVDCAPALNGEGKPGLQIISATKKNLAELVEQGSFRKDLYYRLYGLQIDLVPLARRADLEQMVNGVLKIENRSSNDVGISEAALERLLSHTWEGNFRELHLVLRTAIAMISENEIRVEHLPAAIRRDAHSTTDNRCVPFSQESEKDALLAALQRNRWNVSKTAAALKVSRNTLYRKMKQFRIPKKTD